MANKIKVGLDYFPFEASFFDDIKIRKLIKYQGCKATPIYTLLLCNIYGNGYYLRWDNELPFIISEKTGYEEGYVKEVINCCIGIGLFSKTMFEKHKVLTSNGIQERYQMICKLTKRKSIISEYSVINSEELIENSEDLEINSEEFPQRKEKKRKEKKSKVKEIIEPPSEDEFLNFCKISIPDEFKTLEFSIKQKFRAWIENDWRDGYDKKIINWKSKILNTIPFLKEKYNGSKNNNSSLKSHAAEPCEGKPFGKF